MSWGETLFLRNFIKGQKVFVGGTTPIAPAYVGSKYYRFTPKIDGVVSLSGTVSSDRALSNAYLSLYIYKNSDLIFNHSYQFNGNNYVSFDINIPIEKNSSYRIQFYTSSGINSYLTYKDVYFCGQVNDYNYFDTEVIG